MSKLSLLDLGFFIAETQASPKHVAGLLICRRPPKSTLAFAKNLYRELLTFTDVKAPFNRVIKFSLKAMPHWQYSKAVDLKQHIFYHKLASGCNDRQALYDFVSKLHQPMLDRSRPLWEVHVIDGLEIDQKKGYFALYQKMHHACADGITMSRWTSESMAQTPDDLELTPVWTRKHGGHGDRHKQAMQDLMHSLWKDVGGTTLRFLGIARLATMLLLESVKLTKNAIALPFVSTAKTPLTGQVTAGRQFTTAGVSMARVNQIRERTRSTINHVALTCLDGALRRYLKDQGVELKRPITIQMPVNLRKEGEKTAGNKIGIIQVELSAPTDDPLCAAAQHRVFAAQCAHHDRQRGARGDRVLHHHHRAGGADCRIAPAQQHAAPHGQHPGLQRAGAQRVLVHQRCQDGRNAPHQHPAAQQSAQHHPVQLRRGAFLWPDRDRRAAQFAAFG